jgi:hypothetical protein
MSHRHYCDYAGHYWQCDGAALRGTETEPSLCMCCDHGVPMEEGDHSRCAIELLACPEHREAQLREMGLTPGAVSMAERQNGTETATFKDRDGKPIVGFCLWCNQNFYSMDEVKAHNADDMKACPVFQELKGEQCMPPVLQAMLEKAGLLGDDSLPDPGQKPKRPN